MLTLLFASFIAAAKIGGSHLISNDKIQVESARKSGVKAYYLLEEFENVKEMMKSGIIS